MFRLDWTGNHFLDPGIVRGLIADVAATDWDPTRRNDDMAARLVAAISRYFDIPAAHIAIVPGSAAGIDALLRSLSPAKIVDLVPNFHQPATVACRDGRPYVAIPC